METARPCATVRRVRAANYSEREDPLLTAKHAGIFVSFEGGEGAGKSTQITLLKEWLDHSGYRAVVTREPGGDSVAEKIRRLILDYPMAARTELLLFMASRAQNVEKVIRPRLLEGHFVISDRFIDSSIAYQGYAREMGRDEVAALNSIATGNLVPNMTILIDLDPEVGLARQANRTRMENETLEFHRRVREGYLAEAERDAERFQILDGNRSTEQLHVEIVELIRRLIEAN